MWKSRDVISFTHPKYGFNCTFLTKLMFKSITRLPNFSQTDQEIWQIWKPSIYVPNWSTDVYESRACWITSSQELLYEISWNYGTRFSNIRSQADGRTDIVSQKRLFVPMKRNGSKSLGATFSELRSVEGVWLEARTGSSLKYLRKRRSCVRLLIFSRGCQLCLCLTPSHYALPSHLLGCWCNSRRKKVMKMMK